MGVSDARDRGAPARRPRRGRAAPARPGRRRPHRRAPHDDRQRRRPQRRARGAPRRLGRVDEPRGARRRARARRTVAHRLRRAAPRPQQRRHRRADPRRGRARRARRERRAHVGDPRARERSAAVEPSARARHRRAGVPTDLPVDPRLARRARRSATDAVEIDLADRLRNPWGILHGGVVATLVDLAAEHATGGGCTTDVVLHFLAPNRVGPVRATARVPRSTAATAPCCASKSATTAPTARPRSRS